MPRQARLSNTKQLTITKKQVNNCWNFNLYNLQYLPNGLVLPESYQPKQALQVNARGDGNCAFNAFALYLRHFIELDKWHPSAEQFKRFKKHLMASVAKLEDNISREVFADAIPELHKFIAFLKPDSSPSFDFEDFKNYLKQIRSRSALFGLQMALAPALRGFSNKLLLEQRVPDAQQDIVDEALKEDTAENAHAGQNLLNPLADALGMHLQTFDDNGDLLTDNYLVDFDNSLELYPAKLEKNEPTIYLHFSGDHWDPLFDMNEDTMLWQNADPDCQPRNNAADAIEKFLSKAVNTRVDKMLELIEAISSDKDPKINEIKAFYGLDFDTNRDIEDIKAELISKIVALEIENCEAISTQLTQRVVSVIDQNSSKLNTPEQLVAKEWVTIQKNFPQFTYLSPGFFGNKNSICFFDANKDAESDNKTAVSIPTNSSVKL